mgnify:CR=1 FL=1
MSNKTTNPDQIRALIKNAKGRLFTIIFNKADGTERSMVARAGVHKFVNKNKTDEVKVTVTKRKETFKELEMISVYDMHKLAYRIINLNKVKSFACNKTTTLFGA